MSPGLPPPLGQKQACNSKSASALQTAGNCCQHLSAVPTLSNKILVCSRSFQQFPAVSSSFQQFPVVSSSFQQFPAVSSSFQQFPA
eukprot:15483512-Alexandrium_andersonii.AAC.1